MCDTHAQIYACFSQSAVNVLWKHFRRCKMYVYAFTCTQEPLLANMLIHIKHHFRSIASGGRLKRGSLSKSISLARIYHSSLLSLIHLLIPLFLCHFIQMFQSLFLSMGEWCLVGDYGKVPHFFLSVYILFCVVHSALPLFLSLGACVWKAWVCLLCLCVCVLNLDHAVCLRALLPQHQTPPAMVFAPPAPISVLVCLP